MAAFPSDHISTQPPFTNVGLDVFGPWSISTHCTCGGCTNSKMWAVMFACLSVQVVHIELIESMDTLSLINASRRFFALSGPSEQIRYDRSTTFEGACKELEMLLVDTSEHSVQNYFTV